MPVLTDTLSKFNQLPLEVLCRILCLLDIPDILRVRKVCRYLNEATHCRYMWTDVYRNADFVHPPGPFLSQSPLDMENILVRSFRVHRYLRRSGETVQRNPAFNQIRYRGKALHVDLLFGRFLLVAFKEEVRCYDLDLNRDASTVYKVTIGELKLFRCASAVDVQGHSFGCAVLAEATEENQISISVYSLIVMDQSRVTLELLQRFERTSFRIDHIQADLGPRVMILVDDSVSSSNVIVLDVHSRSQFQLRPLIAQGMTPEWIPTSSFKSILTSTHLLLAKSYRVSKENIIVFNAFTLPSANHHACPAVLSQSHCGAFPGLLYDIVLLHDAIIDQSNHDTLIVAQLLTREGSSRSRCVTLRLSKLYDDEVGTITMDLFRSTSGLPQLYPSFNGTARTFYMSTVTLSNRVSKFGVLNALEYDVRGVAAAVAAEAKFTKYDSVLQIDQHGLLAYDPYSGRICIKLDHLSRRDDSDDPDYAEFELMMFGGDLAETIVVYELAVL